jgi:hypothetical protein
MRRLKRRKLDWTSLLIALVAIGAGLLMFQRSFNGSTDSAPMDGAEGVAQ